MKKLLLLSAFVLSSFFSNAQVISFEASEGFTLGTIYGQNGWTVTGDGSGGFVENQVISSELSTDGAYSLKIATESAFPGQSGPIVGGFYNLAVPITYPEFEVSFDINMSELGGANFAFVALAGTNLAARLEFDFEASLVAVDNVDGALAFAETTFGEWAPQVWYAVRMEFNTIDATIDYYVDNVLIYQGDFLNTTGITQIRFANDNWGGFAYIDNFQINEPTASVNDFFSQNISIYPNPASDIFNLSSATSTIENITLTDLNGRTVKNINVNSLSSAEVNISDLTTGMYFVTVQTDNGSGSTKIIKK